LEGARVLDLFAGTGALGLEALSRGAACVTFVDEGRVALGLLKRNIEMLAVQAEVRVIARDARKLPHCDGEPATLVFLDPPYGRDMGGPALAAARAGGWIAPGALVVWEETAAQAAPAGLRLLEARRYGDTVVTLLEAEGAAE